MEGAQQCSKSPIANEHLADGVPSIKQPPVNPTCKSNIKSAPLKCALLNVNSLISNDRTSALMNLIQVYEFDIFLVTETKLRHATSVHLRNCTPPSFTYRHIPRPKSSNAGGV